MATDTSLCLVSVGKEYNYITQKKLPMLIDKGYRINLMTDNIEFFSEYRNDIDIYHYSNEQFNYLDKVEFTLFICLNKKQNVFYIDVNKIDKTIEKFEQKYNTYVGTNICFSQYWGIDIDTDFDSLKYVKQYFEKKNMILPKIIQGISETIFFIPYTQNIKIIKQKFEELKTVFTFQTMMDNSKNLYLPRYGKQNIGYGGGRLIYLLLEELKIDYEIKYKKGIDLI